MLSKLNGSDIPNADDDDDYDDNDDDVAGDADAGVDWLSGTADRQRLTSVPDPRRRDVFLGGSCGTSRWRDEVAVPLLLLVVHITRLPTK